LKGLAALGKGAQRSSSQQLKGLAALGKGAQRFSSKVELEKHPEFAYCYSWKIGPKSPKKVDTF
jgi:hypothetical protein